MFSKICVEEALFEKNKEFFEKLKVQIFNNAGRVPVICSEALCNAQINSKDILYIGNTGNFLEKYAKTNAVIAVLNEKEDLFAFKYAVEELESIDFDYIKFIYCRFNKIPVEILETKRTVIKEMDVEAAKYFFSLQEKYPEIFCEEVKSDSAFCEEVEREKSESIFYNEKYNASKINSSEINRNNNLLEMELKAAAYIETVYDFYGYGTWAVYEKNSEELIGFVGINNCIVNGKAVEAISYYIKENFRHKGFAVETGRAVIDYVRQEIGLKDIYCIFNKDNTASKNTAKKLDVHDKCMS